MIERDGIADEIIRRIEENGGAIATERLLNELPNKPNVNKTSVRACMQTAKFVIRDGLISLASTSSVQLRKLDDVIDGRDRSGAPYWTFTVYARLLGGYCLTGVPSEFAKALGCAPDAAERIRIENMPGCRDLSLSWQRASSAGALLGHLAEPLRLLGLRPGQQARVTIRGQRLVELSADDSHAEPSGANQAAPALRIV